MSRNVLENPPEKSHDPIIENENFEGTENHLRGQETENFGEKPEYDDLEEPRENENLKKPKISKKQKKMGVTIIRMPKKVKHIHY